MNEPAVSCSDQDPADRPGLTLWRGAPSAAWRTYFSPIREKRGPLWVHLSLMFALNSFIALLLTLGALPNSLDMAAAVLWRVFPFAQSIGVSIMVLHTLGQSFLSPQRLNRWPVPVTLLYRGVLACLGVYIGYTLALGAKTGHLDWGSEALADEGFMASTGIGLIVTFVMYQIMASRARSARVEADIERERARSAASQSREAAARLQLLQAQIEPHFLFNTLANVQGLIASRPEDAMQMLDDFIFYLRASLNVTRGSASTLGGELELLQRYLSIFQFRMGERLTFTISCPPGLSTMPIAPMLLQPLVENSIEHGLEPKIEGGSITVAVEQRDAEVNISIADTGLGFHPLDDAGVGLANIRERLWLLYGDRARLEIEERRPSGTLVQMTLPFTDAPHRGEDTRATAKGPETQSSGVRRSAWARVAGSTREEPGTRAQMRPDSMTDAGMPR